MCDCWREGASEQAQIFVEVWQQMPGASCTHSAHAAANMLWPHNNSRKLGFFIYTQESTCVGRQIGKQVDRRLIMKQ
eukprot:1150639-Pelagomonas_calceolata.AAC.2